MGEVKSWARWVGERTVEVAKMRQRSDCMVKDVHFHRDGLHGRLRATVSKLCGLHNSLTSLHERLQRRLGRSAASNLQLELLLSSFASCVINGVPPFLSDHGCYSLYEAYGCGHCSIAQLRNGLAVPSEFIGRGRTTD